MSDIQRFTTEDDAKAEVEKMRQYGWPNAVVESAEVFDWNGPEYTVWVIRAAGNTYMREDGYVR